MLIQQFFTNPQYALINLVLIVIAIGVHEAAHAFAANRLGDPTPKMQGRLTLNPIKHIDPFGLLFIVVAGIGWGKPVQFNPYNLKHPVRDAALIAFAGPLSNVLMSLIAYAALFLIYTTSLSTIIGGNLLFQVLVNFIVLNIALAVFNLIPIDPLDGFKIVGGLLPQNLAMRWYETQPYGMYVLLILLATGSIKFIVDPVNYFIVDLLFQHFKRALF